MVAALAQRTKRVRLGSSIIVLPLHNPIEIAEQWGMIDLMSNGRVELGIGRGFVEYDYDRLRVPLQGAQDRLKDGLALIRKAWGGERFSHNGPYYQYENLQVWPRPQQRPHPPIWLACGGTPDSFKWAGEQGFGIFTVAYRGVQPLIPLNKLYREAWLAAGHPAKEYKIAAHYQVVLSEDGAEARDIATKALKRYIGATTHTLDRIRDNRPGSAPISVNEFEQKVIAEVSNLPKMVEDCRIVVGTPEDAARVLTRAQEMMGLTQVDCTFYFGGIPFELAQRSHRLFAEKVMPRLRGIG
jgi:alkanesulfonate monooxygenase SsuD/methylene tetrahydromethanopterin reductase-like flavin-dependent oxidoreductase (luciferase family)